MSQAGRYVNDNNPLEPSLKSLTANDASIVFGNDDGNINVYGGLFLDLSPERNINTTGDPGTNTFYVNMNNTIILGDLVPLAGTNPAITLQTGSLFFTGNDAAAQTIQWSRPRGAMDVNGGATPIFRVTSTTNNTLVGAGISGSAISNNNSAFGAQCLAALSVGGRQNTAIGSSAGRLISASNNTMAGYHSLFSLTTGQENCSFGSSCLANLVTGSRNTALGSQVGGSYTGAESSNILIHSAGVIGDNRTLRIGTATGTGTFDLQRSFIQGIRDVTTDNPDTVPVYISADGQLGTNPTLKYVSAYLTNSVGNVTGDGTNYTIIFDGTMSAPTLSGYDTTTGIFTAPENGIYSFTCTFSLQGIDASMTSFTAFFGVAGTGPDIGNTAWTALAFVPTSMVTSTADVFRQNIQGTFTLNANDTVQVVIQLGGSTKTANVIIGLLPPPVNPGGTWLKIVKLI